MSNSGVRGFAHIRVHRHLPGCARSCLTLERSARIPEDQLFLAVWHQAQYAAVIGQSSQAETFGLTHSRHAGLSSAASCMTRSNHRCALCTHSKLRSAKSERPVVSVVPAGARGATNVSGSVRGSTCSIPPSNSRLRVRAFLWQVSYRQVILQNLTIYCGLYFTNMPQA